MRKYQTILLPLILITLACDPEPVLLEQNQVIADAGHTGVYVLSEGLFNQNNSTLSWIDFTTPIHGIHLQAVHLIVLRK